MNAYELYWGRDALDAPPVIRAIRPADCFTALTQGYDDFRAMPSYVAFVGLFYAVAGVALASFASFGDGLHLLFPLASGFALIGPFVAIGLYEMSRRRELGQNADWRDAFMALRSPALPAIFALGLALALLFLAWMGAAQAIYEALYGDKAPVSALAFSADVFGTARGWWLIGVGGLVGFAFAAVTLCVSVVSFQILLDRDVGVFVAVGTSVRLAMRDPLAVATWGAIVAAGLIVGSLPAFLGLALVMPILGHASWRFYRLAVERDPAHEHPAPPLTEPHVHASGVRGKPNSFLFPMRDTK